MNGPQGLLRGSPIFERLLSHHCADAGTKKPRLPGGIFVEGFVIHQFSPTRPTSTTFSGMNFAWPGHVLNCGTASATMLCTVGTVLKCGRGNVVSSSKYWAPICSDETHRTRIPRYRYSCFTTKSSHPFPWDTTTEQCLHKHRPLSSSPACRRRHRSSHARESVSGSALSPARDDRKCQLCPDFTSPLTPLRNFWLRAVEQRNLSRMSKLHAPEFALRLEPTPTCCQSPACSLTGLALLERPMVRSCSIIQTAVIFPLALWIAAYPSLANSSSSRSCLAHTIRPGNSMPLNTILSHLMRPGSAHSLPRWPNISVGRQEILA